MRNAQDFDALVLTAISTATASECDRTLQYLERSPERRRRLELPPEIVLERDFEPG